MPLVNGPVPLPDSASVQASLPLRRQQFRFDRPHTQAELHEKTMVHERLTQNNIHYRYEYVLLCMVVVIICFTYTATSADPDVPQIAVTGRASILGNATNCPKRPQARQPGDSTNFLSACGSCEHRDYVDPTVRV